MPAGHKSVYQIVSDQIVADAEKDPSPTTMARFATYETCYGIRCRPDRLILRSPASSPAPANKLRLRPRTISLHACVRLRRSHMQHRDMIEAEGEDAGDEDVEEAGRMIEDALHRHLLALLKELATLVDP